MLQIQQVTLLVDLMMLIGTVPLYTNLNISSSVFDTEIDVHSCEMEMSVTFIHFIHTFYFYWGTMHIHIARYRQSGGGILSKKVKQKQHGSCSREQNYV